MMDNTLIVLAMLVVIGLGVGAYLLWARCRSSHDKDESSAPSSNGMGAVLAKITLAPRKQPR